MGQLDERVIVVMGGSSGLGLSAARSYVNAGARVVVVGRTQATLDAAVTELGEAALGVCGDAVKPDTSKRAVALARENWGRIDGLYHVAGGSGRRLGDGPLHEVTPEGVDATLDLNLKSVIYSNQAAVNAFLEQGRGGTILNMASVLGYSPAPRYFSTHVYAAAKAAIIGFSKSIAAYYATNDVRVNVIAPALVETPMAKRAAGDEAILDYIRTKQPLDGGRIGTPSDADAAALFFMSEGSRFVTGQVLAVDGGWTVSEGQYPGDE